jgi:hypothetical protein
MDRCNPPSLKVSLVNVQIIAETTVQFGPACTSFAQFPQGMNILSFERETDPDCISGSIGAAQKLNHGDSDIAIK